MHKKIQVKDTTMSLIARAILLRQQLKSKNKLKQCPRCSLFYEQSQDHCPHCAGLNDRQIEELIERQKTFQTGNILHIVFVFSALALFFALLIWIL